MSLSLELELDNIKVKSTKRAENPLLFHPTSFAIGPSRESFELNIFSENPKLVSVEGMPFKHQPQFLPT